MSTKTSTPADGAVRTDAVITLTTPAAPKVTELTGGTVKALAEYITAGGFSIPVTQASIQDERESDTFVAEQAGRTSVSGGTITVIDNTGTTLSATMNDAVDILVPDSTVYLVRRYGLPFGQAWAVGQKVDVFKCKVGKKQRVATEANSVLRSTFALFVQDFYQDVTTVA
jgi:hypothetical protein